MNDTLVRLLRPFIKFIAKIGLPRRKFTGEQYLKLKSMLKPGDLIFTTTRFELTNLFNTSEMKHGAICVNDEHVVEAIGKGVVRTGFFAFFRNKDYVVAVRPKFLTVHNQRQKVVNEAEKLLGSAYDMEFESGDDEYYCMEAQVTAYKKVFPDLDIKASESYGEKVYQAQDIIGDTEKWEIIFDNRK